MVLWHIDTIIFILVLRLETPAPAGLFQRPCLSRTDPLKSSLFFQKVAVTMWCDSFQTVSSTFRYIYGWLWKYRSLDDTYFFLSGHFTSFFVDAAESSVTWVYLVYLVFPSWWTFKTQFFHSKQCFSGTSLCLSLCTWTSISCDTRETQEGDCRIKTL